MGTTGTTDALNGHSVGARVRATRMVFLLAGSCVSAWAPLVPFAKQRLALSDGRLGAVLLCGGGGAVLAMPVAGVLAGRFGCRAVIGAAGALACLALPCLAAANSAWQLAAALLCFGAMNGSVDATMNIQAVFVERAAGRSLMSGFHGQWSVGSIVGAGLVSLSIWLGASPTAAAAIVASAALALLAASLPALLNDRADRSGPAFALPHGTVVLFGLLCLILFLAEGSVLDWSAVFLTTIRQMRPAGAGAGYIVFATAMTVCRLAGDSIVGKLGGKRVVVLGSLLTAVGLLIVITVPNATVGILAFGVAGVGLANTVPVIFSATGRQTEMPTHLAIPAMTTLAYGGTLAGPAVVGFFSNAFGLQAGLLLIVGLLLIAAIVAGRMRVST